MFCLSFQTLRNCCDNEYLINLRKAIFVLIWCILLLQYKFGSSYNWFKAGFFSYGKIPYLICPTLSPTIAVNATMLMDLESQLKISRFLLALVGCWLLKTAVSKLEMAASQKIPLHPEQHFLVPPLHHSASKPIMCQDTLGNCAYPGISKGCTAGCPGRCPCLERPWHQIGLQAEWQAEWSILGHTCLIYPYSPSVLPIPTHNMP